MYHIITTQDYFDILQNFPQLLHFSAPEVTGTESHPRPAPASRIFPLQSLELWLDTRLLAVITLPQLQRLTVRFPDSVNSDQLLAFLSRSHPSIIYFDIRCEWYRCDRALELCIRAVPKLSVLRIQLEGPSDLDNIVSDQHVLNQSNIFPSLRTLHIRDYGHHPLPMPQPVSLLLGRCFRALSARGVRIQLENLSFELPEDLKLNESISEWLPSVFVSSILINNCQLQNLTLIRAIPSLHWIFCETLICLFLAIPSHVFVYTTHCTHIYCPDYILYL
jgi:hypothetical protein